MNLIFAPLTDGDLRRIAALCLLIISNTIFAVVGALMKGGFNPALGGFDAHKFPEFIYKQVLPYLVGFAFFEAFLHLLPPSTLVASLYPEQKALAEAATGIPPVDPAEAWKWLDPVMLWLTYSAIIVDLAKKTFTNLAFMFGKALTLAQGLAAKSG